MGCALFFSGHASANVLNDLNGAHPSTNSEPVLSLSKERAEVRPAHGDSSTGSELKVVEEACREASRTVEPWNVWNDWNRCRFASCLTPIQTRRGDQIFFPLLYSCRRLAF
jgi:hypothetical protein